MDRDVWRLIAQFCAVLGVLALAVVGAGVLIAVTM